MMGPMVMLLALAILAAIVGGIGAWVRRSQSQVAHPASGGAPVVVGEAPPKRVSLVTEAIGYVGTILILAGASAAIGERWSDIATAGRLAILGAATLLFLGIGLFIRSSAEPAFQRLTSVTWAVSVAAFAGTVAVVGHSYDASDKAMFLTIATTSTVYAAVLWWFHQRAIQQTAMFLGVLLSTASVISFTVSEPDAWMIAIPLWTIGLAWAAAGWWRRIAPWFVAVPLGLVVALIAPSAISQTAVMFGLGIGTAAVVMASSVVARFTPGLGMASLALLGYVIGAVTYYFGDTIGVPASLAIAGLLILGLAAAATRWHWFARRQPPPVEPKKPSAAEPLSSDDDHPTAPIEHHHAA